MTKDERGPISRRAMIATTIGGAAVAAIGGAVASVVPGRSSADETSTRAPRPRMPVVFLPHGGGPWPFVDMGLPRAELDPLATYLRSVGELTPSKPEAMLVISAHWEEAVPTVMTSPRPPILYDYYGFPPASYEITWPAPGHPGLASRVQALLHAAGLESAADSERGFDHGTFIPLKLTYPEADVPTVQLSLARGLDPSAHLAMGRALAPLRDEGVLIVGSGMSYHNMRGFGGAGRAASETFDAWLREVATADPESRTIGLERWSSAPAARQAHPREEHLLPLMVIAGAAGEDRGRTAFDGTFAGTRLSAFHYGA